MPGRLEFEQCGRVPERPSELRSEFENDAETLVKDMDFGLVKGFGGDSQPITVPVDPHAAKPEELEGTKRILEAEPFAGEAPVPAEPEQDLELKLVVLDIFAERYDRRVDAKQLVFERALTDYKRRYAEDKKRPKDEKDLLNRTRALARLQTAEDYENFVDGLLCESCRALGV